MPDPNTQQDASATKAPRRRSVALVVSIVVAVMICGGCFSCGLYFTVVVGDTVERIRGHRVIQQEIGYVYTVEPDMEATGELSDEERAKNTFVMTATGSDGEVQIVVEFDQNGGKLKRMITEDGTEVPLDE